MIHNILSPDNDTEHPCKGKFFRCKNSAYLSQGRYVEKTIFYPLHRMSCPGCAKCGWLDDYLSENLSADARPQINEIVDDGIYQLCVTNSAATLRHSFSDDSADPELWFVYQPEAAS